MKPRPTRRHGARSLPGAGSRDPLEVRFPEPLDRALLDRLIWVKIQPRRKSCRARSRWVAAETRWRFTPASPWRRGDYRLVVGTELEDLAGNSVAQPFEVDADRPDLKASHDQDGRRYRFGSAAFALTNSRGRQQGERGPAGGRDPLGVADIAGGPRRLDPAPVVLLLGIRNARPRAIMPRTSGDCSHFASARRASAVSNGSGGEAGTRPPAAVVTLAPAQQFEAPLVRCRALAGDGTSAAARRHTEASVIGRNLLAREPAVGAVDGGAKPAGVGRGQGSGVPAMSPAGGHRSPASPWPPLPRAARIHRRPGRAPAARRRATRTDRSLTHRSRPRWRGSP